MQRKHIESIAYLLIDNATGVNKIIRLAPALKTHTNMCEVLNFFFDYYSDGMQATLKNAQKYITFSKVSISKIHIWLQSINYGIRISLLSEQHKEDKDKISSIYKFFKNVIPKAPLVLRATSKYKFITISKWNDTEFIYCCQKELECINNDRPLPTFISKSFKNDISHDTAISSLQELLNAAEELDAEGNYILSEKILINTENLASKLGQNNEHNKL